MLPVYACDLLASPHEDDHVDARAYHETWDDMVRQQTEGIYPAAFATIEVPILMVQGTFPEIALEASASGHSSRITPGGRGSKCLWDPLSLKNNDYESSART
jgi:hypothetical protein